MENSFNELRIISNEVGNYNEYVQGGGGNTSVKIDSNHMLIKASGYFLNEVSITTGFVCVEYNKILERIENITEKSEEEENRLNEYTISRKVNIADLDFKNLRPSIETGFHALLSKYVIHTHSVYSNIINCSYEGEKILEDIFSDEEYVYINYYSPGLGLTLAIKDALNRHMKTFNCIPGIIFLENHGVIVNDNNLEKVMELHEYVNNRIKSYFSITFKYPEAELERLSDNRWMLSSHYIIEIIKTLVIDEPFFNNKVLFPDQVVYFDNNISFKEDSSKKINICDDKIYFNVDSVKEANAINETLIAYLYINESITNKKLKPRFIDVAEREYIENMESEKFRKEAIK